MWGCLLGPGIQSDIVNATINPKPCKLILDPSFGRNPELNPKPSALRCLPGYNSCHDDHSCYFCCCYLLLITTTTTTTTIGPTYFSADSTSTSIVSGSKLPGIRSRLRHLGAFQVLGFWVLMTASLQIQIPMYPKIQFTVCKPLNPKPYTLQNPHEGVS